MYIYIIHSEVKYRSGVRITPTALDVHSASCMSSLAMSRRQFIVVKLPRFTWSGM